MKFFTKMLYTLVLLLLHTNSLNTGNSCGTLQDSSNQSLESVAPGHTRSRGTVNIINPPLPPATPEQMRQYRAILIQRCGHLPNRKTRGNSPLLLLHIVRIPFSDDNFEPLPPERREFADNDFMKKHEGDSSCRGITRFKNTPPFPIAADSKHQLYNVLLLSNRTVYIPPSWRHALSAVPKSSTLSEEAFQKPWSPTLKELSKVSCDGIYIPTTYFVDALIRLLANESHRDESAAIATLARNILQHPSRYTYRPIETELFQIYPTDNEGPDYTCTVQPIDLAQDPNKACWLYFFAAAATRMATELCAEGEHLHDHILVPHSHEASCNQAWIIICLCELHQIVEEANIMIELAKNFLTQCSKLVRREDCGGLGQNYNEARGNFIKKLTIEIKRSEKAFEKLIDKVQASKQLSSSQYHLSHTSKDLWKNGLPHGWVNWLIKSAQNGGFDLVVEISKLTDTDRAQWDSNSIHVLLKNWYQNPTAQG